MKKFLASVFILLVFGVFVFYLGWTQFRVKPDMVGVVISKTDGVYEKPVVNGEFAWNWQFLLPTNAILKTFSISPVNVTKVIKGQLPSGEVYTSMYSSPDSFTYYFEFSMSLTIAPEAVVTLVKDNKITDTQNLREYLEKAADTLAQLAADYYLKKAQENTNFRPESVRRDDILRNVKLYQDCPEVDLMTFSLTESKIPDFALYKKMQSGFLANQSNVSVSPVVPENSEETNGQEEELADL